MTPRQIELLKSLDPKQVNGTLQGMLIGNDLASAPFGDVCFSLLQKTLIDKETLMKENAKLVSVLKKHGLYTSENILGD